MKTSYQQAAADPGYAQTQRRELKRVRKTIAPIIVKWCKEREGESFELDVLQLHVWAMTRGTSNPSSVDRILRDLRKRGVIDYVCINRRESRYRIRAVHPEKL